MEKKVYYITNPRVKDKYRIPNLIEKTGDMVTIITKKEQLKRELMGANKPELIICDRCTFLLTKEQISDVNNNCFNIHPSFLPFNRGYHPNYWAIYDGTPSGTTILMP